MEWSQDHFLKVLVLSKNQLHFYLVLSQTWRIQDFTSRLETCYFWWCVIYILHCVCGSIYNNVDLSDQINKFLWLMFSTFYSELGRVQFDLVWFWSQLSLALLLSGLVLVSVVPSLSHDLVLVSVVLTTTLLRQIRQYDIQQHIYREEIRTIFIITCSIWDGWSNSGIRHLSSESLWKNGAVYCCHHSLWISLCCYLVVTKIL